MNQPPRGSVGDRVRFFEREVSGGPPERSVQLNRSAYSARSRPIQTAVELPTEHNAPPLHDQSNSHILGYSLPTLADPNFNKEPTRQLVICQELRRAKAAAISLQHQNILIGLLRHYIKVEDEFCTSIIELDEHHYLKQRKAFDIPPQDPEESSFFRSTMNRLTDSLSQYFSSSAASQNKETQAAQESVYAQKVKKYPRDLIDIIGQFLLFVESREYNEGFAEPLRKGEKTLAIKRRENLNKDFRESMGKALYAVLLIIREEQRNKESSRYHPIKELQSLPKAYIEKYQTALTNYLKYGDSNEKTTPIEYPIALTYTVYTPNGGSAFLGKTYTTASEFVAHDPTTVYDPIAGDAVSWIPRIARCPVDLRDPLHPDGNPLVFSSTKVFLDWLRHDNSVSFTYLDQSGYADNRIITLNLEDIQRVSDKYLNDLKVLLALIRQGCHEERHTLYTVPFPRQP